MAKYLFDVSPVISLSNAVDGTLGYSEFNCDGLPALETELAADVSHFFGIKFAHQSALCVRRIVDCFKVIGVYTISLSTKMVDLHSGWYIALVSFVKHAMRRFSSPIAADTRVPCIHLAMFPNPARRMKSPVLRDPLWTGVLGSVVANNESLRVSIDPTSARLGVRGYGGRIATTALAKTVGDGIVRVRHLLASLQAGGGVSCRGRVQSLPGFSLPELYHPGRTQ